MKPTVYTQVGKIPNNCVKAPQTESLGRQALYL
jgi:hypothetical protein